MKFYIAGRYGRRAELAGYAKKLEAMGHEVTSSWLQGTHEAKDGKGTPHEQCSWAEADLRDMQLADGIVAFTEEAGSPHSRGGRHVEFGYAVAWRDQCDSGYWLYVVGPAENVFHHLPEVERFTTVDGFLEWMKRGRT